VLDLPAQIHGSCVGGLRSAQTALPQDDNKKWLAGKKSQPPSQLYRRGICFFPAKQQIPRAI
jgi:hypothetical protein